MKMKSRNLKLASWIILAFAMLVLAFAGKATVFADSVTVGDYTYEIADGKASVAKYNGTAASVTVPTSVKSGGKTYPVTQVGKFAYEGCTSMKTLVIPKEITAIGYGAFKNCTGLAEITINGNIEDHTTYNIYGAGQWIDGEKRNPTYAYTSPFYNVGADASSLVVTFGSGVEKVPNYLFATAPLPEETVYPHVTKVVLASSVYRIGSHAFYDCRDLKSVQMGSGTGIVGDHSFTNATSLSNIQWGKSLDTIGVGAFSGCSSIKTLKFPSKTRGLYTLCFENCMSLTTVELPASLQFLQYSVFKGCVKLSDLTINGNLGDYKDYCADNGPRTIDGDNATYDPAYVYSSCFYKAGTEADSFTVTFSEGVTRIPSYLFATGGTEEKGDYCAVTKVVIPASVTSIGQGAFFHCFELEESEYKDTKAAFAKVNVEDDNEFMLDTLTYALGAPSKAVAANYANGIKVSWSKFSGATGYLVYRNDKLVAKINKASTNSYGDKATTNGSKYVYKIVARNKAGASHVSKSVTIYRLAATAISSLKNTAAGAMTVKWKTNAKAAGYQVQYSLTSSFAKKKTVTVKGGDTIGKKIAKLTKGKTYYVRVRCYKTIGGTAYYSAYGSAKAVKITK